MALYDDTSTVCPICGASLVTYVRQSSSGDQTKNTPVQPISENQGTNNNEDRRSPVFETFSGNEIRLRGLVSNIALNSRSLITREKIADCFTRGVPLQFGNPVYETIIRVEEITDSRIPSQTRSVVFYGNAQGQVDIGDDITVNARRRQDRIIARSIYVNDTESNVHTPLTLNAPALLIAIAAVLLLVLCLLYAFIEWITSGVFIDPLMGILGAFLYFGFKILAALAPIILLIWIVRKLLHI